MHRHAVLAYMMATALTAAGTAGVVASGQPGPASPLSIDAFVFDSQGRPVAEMREAYRQGSYTIEGRAIYSNFRSFQVRTEQEIKVVKSI